MRVRWNAQRFPEHPLRDVLGMRNVGDAHPGSDRLELGVGVLRVMHGTRGENCGYGERSQQRQDKHDPGLIHPV